MKSVRILSLLMTVLLILSMSAAPAFADDVTVPTRGTITVKNGGYAPDYRVYRIFDATVGFDDEGNATGITYTCTDAQKAIPGFGTYFTVSGNNVTGMTAAGKSEDGRSLSAAAIKWIKDNIGTLGTRIPFRWKNQAGANDPWYENTGDYYEGTYCAVFGNLPFGFYLLDSEVGAAVTIDSTNPDAVVVDKNKVPDMEKTITKLTNADGTVHNGDIQIREGEYYPPSEHEATVQIGDTVEYTIHITAEKGAEDYVLFDGMYTGLTLKPESIKVYVGDGDSRTELSADAYTLYATDSASGFRIFMTQEGNEWLYEVSDNSETVASFYLKEDEGNLHLVIRPIRMILLFKQSFLDGIQEPTDIYVVYDAVVNKDAIIAMDEGYNDGNQNEARLHYGHHGGQGVTDVDEVFSARVNIYKYEGDGDSSSSSGSRPLNGVEFVLKNSEGKFFRQDENKVIHWVDDQKNADVLVTGSTGAAGRDGVIVLEGLTNGTYTLVETKPLPGYNPVPDVEFTIHNQYNTWPELKVQLDIANHTGSVLPHTGGMGVTVFYLAGMILLLGAGYVLLRRRRAETR